MNYCPLLVFGYNRSDKIDRCVKTLEKCVLAKETELYIFCDGKKGAKDSDAVESVHDWANSYAKGPLKFKEVHTDIKEKNIGLANSIIRGVTSIINKYGRVIVVEDDLIVEPEFLLYMNNALEYYDSKKNIWSIASYGYNLKALKKYDHDVYLGYRASSWGWATWKDRWDKVDWDVSDYKELQNSKEKQKKLCRGGGDLYPMLQRQMLGKSDSWAIRWNYASSQQDMLTVYPKFGLVRNDGFDGTGIHSGLKAPSSIVNGNVKIKLEEVELDWKITREFYLLHTDTLMKKIKRNLSFKDVVKLINRMVAGKTKIDE